VSGIWTLLQSLRGVTLNVLTGTKQKIILTALELFSQKGYTETSIREIAAVVGIKESSIYNHFESKNSILDYILEKYRKFAAEYLPPKENLTRLTKDAQVEDVMACLYLRFPEGEEDYFIKTMFVLFQEHYRNPTVREFLGSDMIKWQEGYISDLLNRLVKSDALDQDTDIEFWAKTHVSITYMYTGRLVMGIGDLNPGYEGKTMYEMIRSIYETIFKLHGRSPSTAATGSA